MINPYHEGFDNWEDVQREFKIAVKAPRYVLFACYDDSGYDGSAVVIYYDNNKYWLADGSHCSCYGLEDQWDPTEYATAGLLDLCVVQRGYGITKKYGQFISDALARNEARIRRAKK